MQQQRLPGRRKRNDPTARVGYKLFIGNKSVRRGGGCAVSVADEPRGFSLSPFLVGGVNWMECLRSQLAISNYFLCERLSGRAARRARARGEGDASAVSDRRSD